MGRRMKGEEIDPHLFSHADTSRRLMRVLGTDDLVVSSSEPQLTLYSSFAFASSAEAKKFARLIDGQAAFAHGTLQLNAPKSSVLRAIVQESTVADWPFAVAVTCEVAKPAGRPFTKWAGGKTKLLPELVKRVPERFGAYHEPFVGGGALFWHLASVGRLDGKKRRVTLSDACEPLMRTYRAIRDDVSSVIRHLKKKPITEEYFYKTRSMSADVLRGQSDAEVAAWFIYVNKTCFNGIYRVNGSGVFNVPWGKWLPHKLPTTCDESNLRACSATLVELGAVLNVRSFDKTLDYVKKGDLIYFDPPYLPTSATADFTTYTSGGFDYDDHVRLRDVALELKKRGVHVLLSNSNVPLVRELYEAHPKHFKVDEVMAARSINSDGAKRGLVKEILVR